MDNRLRAVLAALVVFQMLLALGFILQLPPVTALWPLPGATALSFVFIGSMAAASAASLAWCVLARERAALVGIGLDYLAVFGPLVVLALIDGGLGPIGPTAAIDAAFGVALVLVGARVAVRDPRPMPAPVRVSFAVFVVVLVGVAGLLLNGVPDVLPWQVSGETAFVFGMFFVGASAYFLYGLVRPSWANAAGQLAGFLAYDLVLIGPFLSRLPTMEPRFALSLVLYIIVLVASGVLAAWYLVLDPLTGARGTRRRGPGSMADPAG